MSNRIVFVLSEDPEGLGDDLAEWTIEHARELVEVPGILSAQVFRVDPRQFKRIAGPETPDYRHLTLVEIADDFPGPDPSAPLPVPPGGIGPNRPASFIFASTSEVFRKP